MSRVGKVPVKILSGVKVEVKDSTVKVEGPKGKLAYKLPRGIIAKVENGHVVIGQDKASDVMNTAALYGLSRTLIHNMVTGVHNTFNRELDIVGVGFRAAVKGATLSLSLGYSQPIDYELPQGVSAKVENNTHIVISGADKMLVGLVAAKIRSFKKPEPYQGKGVKYADEQIVRKQGKAAGAK
ncbi:MAG: 50S ribosomal protein L6 [Bdellovibrionota bacterium]